MTCQVELHSAFSSITPLLDMLFLLPCSLVVSLFLSLVEPSAPVTLSSLFLAASFSPLIRFLFSFLLAASFLVLSP